MVRLKEPPRLNEEELPEARVPTTLVRNQVTILGEDGLEHDGLFTVGPYHVIRGLVRAPQAWLVEGIGPTGERTLIQLVHCRSVSSRAEELERQAFERQIADDTVLLFDEPGFIVHAHGHVQRGDGSHVLFWALPWHEGALNLARPGSTIRNVDHLLEIAVALASRVQRRHDKERLDSLLSEALVAVTDQSTDLLGVPIFIPPSWLAPDMPSAKMAPEEKGLPTRLGDVWRLGQALTALAATLEAIPSTYSNLLRWMTHEDPKKRPPRAIEVEVECRNIRERLPKSPLTSPARPATSNPLSFEEVSQLIVASMGPKADTLPTESDSPAEREMAILHGEDEVTLAGSVNVKAIDHPPSPTGVPPWAFFFSHREYERFEELLRSELTARRLGHRIGTGVVQLIAEDGAELEYLGLSDMARDCFRTEADQWRQLIAKDIERQIGALADTLDSERRRRAKAHLDEPTQKMDERHLRLLPDAETDPPPGLQPPPPTTDDLVEIKVGGALDLAAIVEPPMPGPAHSSETIADRPAVHGPNPTSPFAGTLPSMNPEASRVPESLRRVIDDLPFQPTLPAPQDKGHVPEDLRAAAKKNLDQPKEFPTWPDVYAAPAPITPDHDAREIAVPKPAPIPKGFTVAARPVELLRPIEPPHPEPKRPAPERAPLIEGTGTLDPSVAAAAKGSPARNLLVAALLVVTVAAVVASIMFAERPVEERTTFTEVTLGGEIILRADPPTSIVVGEGDGRVLGQAPLRFLLPMGAEAGVIVTAPGRMPKRVVLTGAGEVTAGLDEIPKHAQECEVPFNGINAALLSGVTGNMEVASGRLTFKGSSVVRTKPGSRESGAWVVRCPPSGMLETITLDAKPIEAAELQITKPQGATAYVEGKSIGAIPAGITVPKAFTKVAIDEGQGSRGPLWIAISTDIELRLPIVPENLAR